MSNPLGQNVEYPRQYSPELLVGIARAENRKTLELSSFEGVDIWNAYELSWLDLQGKPQVARGRFIFPCSSPNIVESKSLKLYLNSLNQEKFEARNTVSERIQDDLSKVSGAAVQVALQSLRGKTEILETPAGICLDELALSCENYETSPQLLSLAGNQQGFDEVVDEVLYTDLFRSNCPITNQPDWASITVCYQGKKISHESLLQYLVSYRLHNDYHENCVERIFCDIQKQCEPQSLIVEANFLRRGGLDINPVRSSEARGDYIAFPRYIRQ